MKILKYLIVGGKSVVGTIFAALLYILANLLISLPIFSFISPAIIFLISVVAGIYVQGLVYNKIWGWK